MHSIHHWTVQLAGARRHVPLLLPGVAGPTVPEVSLVETLPHPATAHPVLHHDVPHSGRDLQPMQLPSRFPGN